MKQQLSHFSESLSETFFNNAPLAVPKSWEDAFATLHREISRSKQKVVIFLDELPWLATARSGLLGTLEYYWNRHWQQNPNIILIVCGSSASWIIKKIVNNKGGLHGRLTRKIHLKPFDLQETKRFLQSKKIKLKTKQITNIYMAIGGIPYYLKHVEKGMTSDQIIEALLFTDDAPLENEFHLLFHSLFDDADAYIELIRLISKKTNGVLRSELSQQVKLSSTGSILSNRLNDLCLAGFIDEATSFNRRHGEYYKLADEFCLFYLTWLDTKAKKKATENYWATQALTPAYKSWTGYAFEALCKQHIKQVVKALRITTGGLVSSWRFIPRKNTESGAQIDLLIERNDNAITLIEIKYNDSAFKIDKAYAKNLENKVNVFKMRTGTHKQIFLALIAANGIKESMYSDELLSTVITLEDLFAEV